MLFGKKRILLIILLLLAAIMAAGCGTNRGGDTSEESTDTSGKATQSENFKTIQRMDEKAADTYQLAGEGKFAEALASVQEVSNLMTQVKFEGYTSAEGMSALSETVLETNRTLVALRPQAEQVVTATAKLRLATDALSHPNDAMWRQYYNVLKDDVRSLEQAAQAKQADEARKAFDQYEKHYDIVRPAIRIDLEPWLVQKADSLTAYFRTQLSAKQPNYQTLASGAKSLSDTIDELFGKKEDRSAYLTITDGGDSLYITLVLGLFIVTVLAYAAWRMWPAKSGGVPIRRRNDGD